MTDFAPNPDDPKSPKPDAEGISFSAAANGKKTIHVKHPVHPDVKRKMVNSGYRILDARFAPPGDRVVIYDGMTGKPVGAEAKGKTKAPAKE